MSYLLDTNVISEIMKPAPNQALLQWIADIDSDNLYLSVITIGEMRKGIPGIQNPQRKETISHWLEIELPDYFDERILNIDVKIADTWGKLQSEMKGYTMPAIDGLIAATAHVHNLKLVTRNIRDFIYAPIEIINPWDA